MPTELSRFTLLGCSWQPSWNQHWWVYGEVEIPGSWEVINVGGDTKEDAYWNLVQLLDKKHLEVA